MLNNPLMKVLRENSEIIVRVKHPSISMTEAKKVAFHYIHHRRPTEAELSSDVAMVVIRDVPEDVVNYIRSLPSSP